jgi:dual oxidase maturation factor 1
MNLLLTAVPRYGAYGMCLTGTLLLGASIGYYLMLPKPPLTIFIDGARIEFSLGWCFWMVLIAGSFCFVIGVIISAIDLIWPHEYSTILEVYYDTPYDRHVILEESHDVRYRKRNSKGGLEEPVSLGSRILRRLSSKTREQTLSDLNKLGISNPAFQKEHVPKSPWRYPFRRSHQLPPMIRTASQDSNSSIASAAANMNASTSTLSPTHLGVAAAGTSGTHSLRREALSRMLPP